MDRRSPPLVNQKCEWRMFGIFNLREAHSDGRSVSNSRQLDKHTSGNGKSRIGSDVLSTVDEKYPDVDVCSRRRRGYSCKSVRVENDRIADLENEVTKMIVNQRFFNKNSQGKDGADCQPNQFLDAVQVLYSNKELFTKLLQDPNSLLVKQIHDIQKTQVKAEQNEVIRLNKAQNSSSFDRFNLSSNCESQSSKKIVTNNAQHFADTSSGNAQNIKPSNFAFGEIKRKLRHVMRVRRKEQQCGTTDSAPSKFPSSSQDLEDGKNVKKLDTSERNSPINVHVSSEKSLKFFKLKDSESSMRQEEVASEQNKLTVKDQGVKVLSHKKQQMVLKALHRDGESCSYSSSSAQKIKDLPVATFSNELQVFGAADISVNKSLSADNLHAHYDIPRGTDGSLVQVDYDRFEENHLEDLITSSLDPMNNKSKDIISEVLQTFSLKCDEPMKSHLSNLLMDSSSTFDEVNGLTDQLFDSTILHEYIIECFMELYQNSDFSPYFSSRNPNFQACVVRKVLVRQINELVKLHFFPHPSPITLQQLVERDLARRESWMTIHVDAEEIAMEVEKNVLETLVLEIVSEMTIS